MKLFTENKDKSESNLNMTANTDNLHAILQPPNILSGTNTRNSASEMNCNRESVLTNLSASKSRTMLQPTGFQSLLDTNASLIKRNRQQANVPSLADGEQQTLPQTILQHLSQTVQTVTDILPQPILKPVWICNLLYRI